MYAIERRQWKEALNQQPAANTPPHVQLVAYWSRAIAAGHLRDSAAAQDALKHGDELIEDTRKGDKPYLADSLKDTHDVMQAWADYASGKTAEAVALLRSVADTEDKVGKGETDLPVREMLADMLMDMQRPKEALADLCRILAAGKNVVTTSLPGLVYGRGSLSERYLDAIRQAAQAGFRQGLPGGPGRRPDGPGRRPRSGKN